MPDLIVNGGKPLSGTITPSGNKNSVLPILCATLLTDEPVTLRNVPGITDVEKLVTFFSEQGSRITWDKTARTMAIDHSRFDPRKLEGGLPSGMRSAVLLFAPLLQRMKKIVLPTNAKGCSLGIRELDPHLICSDAECGCAAGFDDCDGDPGNGCEAALESDAAGAIPSLSCQRRLRASFTVQLSCRESCSSSEYPPSSMTRANASFLP